MEFLNQSKQLQDFTPGKPGRKLAKLISITSGKGGVGKSNFILNLAIAMSIRNKKVLLIDADMNLSNLDILIGVYPQYTLKNLLDDIVDVEDLLVEGPKGIRILPANSGDYKVQQNTAKLQKALIQAYRELRPDFDYILIDTGAGISEYTTEFVYTSDKIIIITTPEPTAITDAYAMIKMLHFHMKAPDISVVINMVQTVEEGKTIYDKISQIVQHFLNRQVHYMGCILHDRNLKDAVQEQVPLIIKHPRSVASAAIHNMAMTYLKQDMKDNQ
ncbi:MAG: MinD/ParA family protein [Candidatus Cloacimonetes bacterium]|nr:MinD/ParA family protein [Candidatus Cloacimonadota bacterium]